MSKADEFVNKIVEATDDGDWEKAISIWNEMTKEYLESDNSELILEVYSGVSSYGINMGNVLEKATGNNQHGSIPMPFEVSQGGARLMWTTIVICAAIFTLAINMWIQSQQDKRDRQKVREEEWTRQSRISALYGRKTFEESNVEEN